MMSPLGHKILRFISPSIVVADERGKHHAMRAHKPQAVSDWLHPLSLGSMAAFG